MPSEGNAFGRRALALCTAVRARWCAVTASLEDDEVDSGRTRRRTPRDRPSCPSEANLVAEPAHLDRVASGPNSETRHVAIEDSSELTWSRPRAD